MTLPANKTKIYLAGIMGSGKSSAGKILAARLGWTFLDADLIIENHAGKSIPAIFASEGEEQFRELESRVVRRLASAQRAVIALGGGALEREDNREAILQNGLLVWLNVSPEVAAKRLIHSENRPLLSEVDSEQEIHEKLNSIFQDREDNYRTAHLTLDLTGESPASIAQSIIDRAEIDRGPRDLWEVNTCAMEGVAPYPVYIDEGVLASVPELFPKEQLSKHAVIITDRNVDALYKDQIVRGLTEKGFMPHVRIIRSGEASKSMRVLGELYNEFSEAGLDRKSPVFALGGGVVGDLAGFFAASYLRGIPLVHIPTTLLAQVDSSIGGKVGVNLEAGKNLVGAFYNPILICMDINTLSSLPDREWNTGMGEVIKYGFIGNGEILDILHGGFDAVSENLHRVVRLSVEEKLRIVNEDFKEGGIRRFLNFGHTLGHALEKITEYRVLNHGEAVYYGMLAALFISAEQGLLSRSKFESALKLMDTLQFDLPLVEGNAEDLYSAIFYDKKKIRDTVHWVLLKDFGHPVISSEVRKEVVMEAIQFAWDFIYEINIETTNEHE
ncbi:MAG TPA: 3-dehydroquinate synthase [bacterium]|nr:3-dehydroquinate synthase [bacterium]